MHDGRSSSPARPRFRDADRDLAYEREGYVVVPGAAKDVVRDLRRAHRRIARHVPDGFSSTMYSADLAHKEATDAEVRRLLGPVVDALLEDHQVLLASFITKRRGGPMPPHQDWTFVDERRHSSMNVWVPLVDVDERNGALEVLPGGQTVPFTIRGTDTDNPFREVEEPAHERMVLLPMRAGDALVHDHRVLHSSPPNRRRRPRVVAGCAVLPAGCTPVHHRAVADGVLEDFEVDSAFFVENTFGSGHLPERARSLGERAFRNPVLTVADLPGGRS